MPQPHDRPGDLHQGPCAAGGLSSFASFSFTRAERGHRTGFLTAPAPQEPASQEERSHCPSCLPIIIAAHSPGIQSHPKHHLTASPFYSENPWEGKRTRISQISYTCPALCLFVTQPAQLWCDTSFSTKPTHKCPFTASTL